MKKSESLLFRRAINFLGKIRDGRRRHRKSRQIRNVVRGNDPSNVFFVYAGTLRGSGCPGVAPERWLPVFI